MKENAIRKVFWYLSFIQLIYIIFIILLSYIDLENKIIINIIRIIGEFITLPIIFTLVICIVYFGLKVIKTKQNHQYILLFSINAFSAALLIYFIIIQA